MSTTAPSPTELQEQFLDNVRQTQKQILEAVQTWPDTSGGVWPDVPMPSLPPGSPEPKELIAGAFDMAEKLLANQREFTEALLAALAGSKPGQPSGTRSKSSK